MFDKLKFRKEAVAPRPQITPLSTLAYCTAALTGRIMGLARLSVCLSVRLIQTPNSNIKNKKYQNVCERSSGQDQPGCQFLV